MRKSRLRFRLRLREKSRLRSRLESLLNLSLLQSLNLLHYLNLSLLRALALTLTFLIGCGQVGQKGTTPVSISFKIPSTNQKALQAAAPTGISSISLEVTASNMTTITKSISVTAGDLITIDLDVPAGSSRKFKARAFDNNNTVIYQGKTTVDLVAGVATIVVIDMDAVVKTLSITLAGNGSGTVPHHLPGSTVGQTAQNLIPLVHKLSLQQPQMLIPPLQDGAEILTAWTAL